MTKKLVSKHKAKEGKKEDGKNISKVEPVQGENGGATQGTSSLKEAIAESRDAIASAEGVKRGPGRPRKTEQPVQSANKTESVNPAPPETQAIVIGSDTIAKGYAMGTAMLAEMRNFPGWKMDEETCKHNAVLTDAVLKHYMPQVESKHAALMSLSFSLVTWVVFTAISENAYKKSLQKEIPEIEEVKEIAPVEREKSPLEKQLAFV